MKKYLSITGYVVFYLAAVFAISIAVGKVWLGGWLPKSLTDRNYDLVVFISFVLVLSLFAIVFKARNKSLFKTCNFSRLGTGNFMLVLAGGILMGAFTCCICNTSFVIKNIPIFEQSLTYQLNGYQSFWVFLPMIAVTFSMEEMIFRGTIFNEIRSGVPVYLAVLITTAVYGLINTYSMGIAVGIYASVAALLYNLAYVYLRSILASMILQSASIWVIASALRTGLWFRLGESGDGWMMAAAAVFMLSIIILYRFIYTAGKTREAVRGASVTAHT